MTLEQWLYRRDREECILSVFTNTNFAKHLKRQDEAEQAIEEILRA